MDGIEGRTAIVTGGARSIGEAVVRAFVSEGASVCIVDVLDKEGEALSAELGDKVHFVRTDLQSDDDIQASIDAAVERFGGIDFLVNAAAIYLDKGMASTRAQWTETFDVNLFGGVMMLRAAHPHLAASDVGAVVNFSSNSGNVAEAGRWLYPATKAAIQQVTRSAAVDVAKDGIRVNAVVPGMTWSVPLQAIADANPGAVEGLAQQVQMIRRPVHAEEVARGVLFLCSSDATGITGGMLPIDGGSGALGGLGTMELVPE